MPGGEKDRPALVSSAEDRTAALAEAEALCVATLTLALTLTRYDEEYARR